MKQLWIAYATVEGQSARIAERIAAVARRAGWNPTVADLAALAGDDPAEPLPPGGDAAILVASVHLGHHADVVETFVRGHRDWLAARPCAFFSVSLGAASERAESRAGAREILDRFLAACAWQPLLARPVAGALAYSRYGFWKRLLMRRIARSEGGPTDTRHDYEYTDWAELAQAVRGFLADAAAAREQDREQRR